MNRLITACALTLALGIAAAGAQEKPAPAPALKAPAMPLHKALEARRVKVAAETAAYVVSVEIDYERAETPAVPQIPGMPPIPGLTGAPNDPFLRYDLGPFSGLVAGTGHVLISDRSLGEFSLEGPADVVKAITVTLPNGSRWPARVVARNQQIDLALLAVDCDITKASPGMKVARLPEGKVELQRGGQVIVVGRGQNPLGTLVNPGVVSALEREDGRAFQLDARISNSTLGAPVVDKDGQIVGIVTLHNHRQFGQASGVSYSAYIHEVAEAYKVLREGKSMSIPPRPYMGVGAEKKWEDKPGLEIGSVISGSGAERAGLTIGDIILSIDDKPMNEVEDLQKLIAEKKVGDTLKVVILRGDEEREVSVTLGRRP